MPRLIRHSPNAATLPVGFGTHFQLAASDPFVCGQAATTAPDEVELTAGITSSLLPVLQSATARPGLVATTWLIRFAPAGAFRLSSTSSLPG